METLFLKNIFLMEIICSVRIFTNKMFSILVKKKITVRFFHKLFVIIPRFDRNSSMIFCLKYSNQIFPLQTYLPLLSILNCLVNGDNSYENNLLKDNSKTNLRAKNGDSNGLWRSNGRTIYWGLIINARHYAKMVHVFHLIHPTTLWGRYYCPPFPDEETGTWREVE